MTMKQVVDSYRTSAIYSVFVQAFNKKIYLLRLNEMCTSSLKIHI